MLNASSTDHYNDDSSYDVIIVGAGLSGLYAADRIANLDQRRQHHQHQHQHPQQHQPASLKGEGENQFLKETRNKLKVCILEARDRCGGRTLSQRVLLDKNSDTSNRIIIDLGGQWVSPQQHRVLSLVEELKLHLVEQTWFSRNGHQEVDDEHDDDTLSSHHSSNRQDRKELQTFISAIDHLADSIDPHCPWAHPMSKKWDSMTVVDFIDEYYHSNPSTSGSRCSNNEHYDYVKREFCLIVQTINSVMPHHMSFLFYLFFIKTVGGLNQVGDGPMGAQHWKIQEGAQALSLGLENRIPYPIFYQEEIVHIHQQDSSNRTDSICTIHTSTGNVFHTKRLILAIPPVTVRNIRFQPELPKEKRQLIETMVQGCSIKSIAIYKEPFWKNGMARNSWSELVNYGPHVTGLGPVDNLFEAQLDDTHFALIGLITGEMARSYMAEFDHMRIQHFILEQYNKVFHTSLALEPLEFYLKEWTSENFTKGCFMSCFPPGNLVLAQNFIRCPTGRLHWAGTETATEWYGYFEGALQAGERAADEVYNAVTLHWME